MNKKKFIDDKYEEFNAKINAPAIYRCVEHHEWLCKECMIKTFLAQMMNEYDELKTK